MYTLDVSPVSASTSSFAAAGIARRGEQETLNHRLPVATRGDVGLVRCSPRRVRRLLITHRLLTLPGTERFLTARPNFYLFT